MSNWNQQMQAAKAAETATAKPNTQASPLPTEYWNPTTSSPGVVTGTTPGIGTTTGNQPTNTYAVSTQSALGQQLISGYNDERQQLYNQFQQGEIDATTYNNRIDDLSYKEGQLYQGPTVNEQGRSSQEVIKGLAGAMSQSYKDQTNSNLSAEEKAARQADYDRTKDTLLSEYRQTEGGAQFVNDTTKSTADAPTLTEQYIKLKDSESLFGQKIGNQTTPSIAPVITEGDRPVSAGEILSGLGTMLSNPLSPYGAWGPNVLVPGQNADVIHPDRFFSNPTRIYEQTVNKQDKELQNLVNAGTITQQSYDNWRSNQNEVLAIMRSNEASTKQYTFDVLNARFAERMTNTALFLTAPFASAGLVTASPVMLAGIFMMGGGLSVGSNAVLNRLNYGGKAYEGDYWEAGKDFVKGGLVSLWFSGIVGAAAKEISSVGSDLVKYGKYGSRSAGTALSTQTSTGTGFLRLAHPRIWTAGKILELSTDVGWVGITIRSGLSAGVGGGLGYMSSGGDTRTTLISAGIAGGGAFVFQGLPKAARGGYRFVSNRLSGGSNVLRPGDPGYYTGGVSQDLGSTDLANVRVGPEVPQAHITKFASELPTTPEVQLHPEVYRPILFPLHTSTYLLNRCLYRRKHLQAASRLFILTSSPATCPPPQRQGHRCPLPLRMYLILRITLCNAAPAKGQSESESYRSIYGPMSIKAITY
jgi:hypothetical protein